MQALPKDEALAILSTLEKKRREKSFIKYWEPSEDQRDCLTKFSPDKKIIGLLGGNRSGKTEIGAFIDVAWALGKEYFQNEPAWEFVKNLPIPPPPNNIWIVGLDFATVRDVIWNEKLKTGRNHPPFLPKDGSVRKANDGDFQIYFENGSIITCKSADSGREKFQGASIDLVHIDEECEADVFDECFQRTIDCAGKILLTLTPLTDISSGVRTPWVFDLYEDWKAGKSGLEFCKLSLLRNPHVPEEEKERAKEKWAGHPEEQARLYGDFVQRSGLVYPMWARDKHLLKLTTPIPRDWTRIVCIDPAPTGVTAAVWCAVDPVGNLLFHREYYEKDRIVSEHAKSIRIVNAGEPVDIWLIDPKGGSQRNAETHKTIQTLYRENGLPVRLAEVGEDFGRDVFREYLNATITEGARHPYARFTKDLPNFEFEIEHYSWATYTKGELKGLTKERPVKKHDHLLNCCQYIAAMRPKFRRRDPMPEEFRRQQARNNSYT